MTSRKGKTIAFLLIFLTGIVLFVYGLLFHSATIWPQQTDESAMLVASERELIKEVSVGGVKRDDSGKIKQIYTGEAPKACPT